MSTTAIVIFATFTLWLLANDAKRRAGVSPALWAVVAWITLVGSRPVSAWFDMGPAVGTAAEAYDEGNPLERGVYFFLIFFGILVLLRRNVRLRVVIASNAWLFLFFAYWGLSVFWADASFVSFKRWTKDLGNMVMVMVVLSDSSRLNAIKAVLKRSACILVPVSVLFIRFVPALGRTYHSGTGEMMYTGVTTHKNSLGVLALVCLIFLLWEFVCKSGEGELRRSVRSTVGDLTLLLMAGWLLLMSGSATALGCAAVGATIVMLLSLKGVRAHARSIEFLGFAIGTGLWASGAAQSMLEFLIVDVLGRDLTLTTRTDVWPVLLSRVDSVLVGSGFNSFWTGERLAELYGQLGIIQAHNGYLETYLNGGLLGVTLLAMVLLSAIRVANRQLTEGGEYASLAFAWVFITVVYNFTEASFNKTSLLWFAFLLMVTQYRDTRSPVTSGSPVEDADKVAAAARSLPMRVPW